MKFLIIIILILNLTSCSKKGLTAQTFWGNMVGIVTGTLPCNIPPTFSNSIIVIKEKMVIAYDFERHFTELNDFSHLYTLKSHNRFFEDGTPYKFIPMPQETSFRAIDCIKTVKVMSESWDYLVFEDSSKKIYLMDLYQLEHLDITNNKIELPDLLPNPFPSK